MQVLMLFAMGLFAQARPGTQINNSDIMWALLLPLCCGVGGSLVIMLPAIIGIWKVFVKAGEPGWASLVPIYNVMVLAKIGGREPSYGLLTLIPVAGIYFAIMILVDVCKKFNVGGGFVAGLILLGPVFWPMLGFGNYTYEGRGRSGSRGGRSSRRRDEDEEEEEDRPRRKRRRDEDEDDN